MNSDLSTQIIYLNDKRSLNPEYVGNKIATLAKLYQEGFPVPYGFCITTLSFKKIIQSHSNLYEIKNLKDCFLDLRSKGIAIVRSSASHEDNINHLFPGILKTIKNIDTYPQFIHAIFECIESLNSEEVELYCKFKDICSTDIILGLLVQIQLKSTYSGVVFTKSPLLDEKDDEKLLIELIDGESSSMLTGMENGALFSINKNNIIKQIANPTRTIKIQDIKDLLINLKNISKKIELLFKQPQDIEWSFSANNLFILQSRPISNVLYKEKQNIVYEKTPNNKKPGTIFRNENKFGLKGAAMIYFSRNGLFTSKPVIFFKPNTNISSIKSRLFKTNFQNEEIAVRYSYQNELGLPRYFASDVYDAFDFIKKTINRHWFVIVHRYIQVYRSFELYITSNGYILEHIPGIWESDNTLNTDVIVYNSEKQYALVYPDERRNKILLPANEEKSMLFKPTSEDIITSWFLKTNKIIKKINNKLKKHYPLICHFVSDREDNWNFLNIRKTTSLLENKYDTLTHSTNKLHFYIVKNMSDVKRWDGNENILLHLSIKRGYEILLRELIPFLQSSKVNVYVDFGILSHPAIILREFGIHPIPVYLNHKVINLGNKG